MKKKINIAGLCVLVLLVNPVWADHSSVALGVSSSSAISTESAVTLPKGKWAVGIRSEYQVLGRFSDRKLIRLKEADEDGDFHSVDSLWNNSIGVSHGVTDDFTVGIRLPFIHRNDIREAEHGAGVGEVAKLGDIEGVGDLSVFGQYRFFQNTNTHAAIIFGFKAPTGKTNRDTDGGDRFRLEFQPGSGSWDGTIGGALTHKMGALSLDTSALYTISSEGKQHTTLGDIVTYNAALSYRLLGQQMAGFLPPNFSLDLIAEINGEWREKEETRGVSDPNTGGNLVYFSPGMRVSVAENVNIGFSFGVPIVKDTNGQQVEPDYRLITTGSIFW